MLNSKTLTKLIVITLVCSIPVVALVFEKKSSAIKNKNAVFLPHLLDKPDQVTRVIIQDHTQTLTFERGADSWLLVEKHNFPVLSDKVQQLLFGLADMRIVEQKTANPQLYSQLDVNDISEEDSAAMLVTVQDDQNQDLAKVLIGKREGLRLGEEYSEHIFVRKQGEAQTWLVQGLLPISNDFKDWVEQPLLGLIDADTIKHLAVTRPDGNKIRIAKVSAEQEDFNLETFAATPGMSLDIDSVNTLPFEVAELEFDDVAPLEHQSIDWQHSVNAELHTFPGINIALNIVKHDEHIYAKAHATAAWDASAEVQRKVAEFNSSKENWVYRLPPEFYQMITVNNADFLKVADVGDVE